MLDPGTTPHENIQFLLVLTCILKAVNKHADLLRESAADPGNDHRLGANEAPPAIISVFLGEQLEDVIDQLIRQGKQHTVWKAESWRRCKNTSRTDKGCDRQKQNITVCVYRK